MGLSNQNIVTFYTYCIAAIAAFMCYSYLTNSSVVVSHTAETNVCSHPSLAYDINGSVISGSVFSDFMNVFVLMVDDSTQNLTPEYIITSGIIHGKYIKGERWEINTESFYTFPGALYIMGTYANNQCSTRPIYVNLPLFDYVLGQTLSFDATFVEIGGVPTIMMRGNTIIETQYYLLYRDSDSYVHDNELFIDEHYIGLGKNGLFLDYDVSEAISLHLFAFVGCRAEQSKSAIVKIRLSQPSPSADILKTTESQYEISAKIHPRERPAPVNQKDNSGGLELDESKARTGNANNSPIRIVNIRTLNNAVFIRGFVIGGPFDVYYMVRPESKERGEPNGRTVMKYGERAGQMNDISFDVVVTDYMSSVRNVVYFVAVKGKVIYGPTKRRFFP